MDLPKSRYHGGTIVKDAKYAWYGDLESLIQETYGKSDYNLLDGDGGEHSQNSVITFDVGPEGNKYGDIDDLTVEEWVAGEEKTLPWGYVMTQPSLADICDDLFKRGLIPAGYYCVEVSW